MTRRAPAPRTSGSWWGHGDLAASLVVIFPLLLVYEIGVLFAGSVNGADVVTRTLYGALGRSTYLLFHVVLAACFLLWIRRGQRWSSLTVDIAAPVLLEAALYALTLGAAVSLILEHVLGLGITAASIVNACGAGVHEELVFRLGVFGGLVALGRHLGCGRSVVAIALVVSSVLFSAAHHVGAYGDAWSTHAFAFRCLAGVAFGLVFWFRSLAHVVYAHAFYDILVYWRA